jgi:hypothetical protein
METRLPTSEDIAELVAFLPQLYEDGFTPIRKWHGGEPDDDGAIEMPWPEYDELVEEFFQMASKECWCNYNYQNEEAVRMLEDHEIIRNASLSQIKTMLTFCVRGERFCDGHWASMIESDNIRRILERLAEL